MTFDKVEIIKSKQAYRARLEERPAAEKTRVSQKLRKQAISIAQNRRELSGKK